MLDLPIGGTIIPKEEIKKAPLLKIEVKYEIIILLFRSLKGMLCLRILFFKLMLAA